MPELKAKDDVKIVPTWETALTPEIINRDIIAEFKKQIKELKKQIKELKNREDLTETEQDVLSEIMDGRLAQYPLVTTGKKPDRYAKTHRRTASLKKKLIRMKLIPDHIA